MVEQPRRMGRPAPSIDSAPRNRSPRALPLPRVSLLPDEAALLNVEDRADQYRPMRDQRPERSRRQPRVIVAYANAKPRRR